jgi:hypothetical protein
MKFKAGRPFGRPYINLIELLPMRNVRHYMRCELMNGTIVTT